MVLGAEMEERVQVEYASAKTVGVETNVRMVGKTLFLNFFRSFYE